MSKIHIANLMESERRTIRAWADMDLGDLIRIVDDGNGGRAALPLTTQAHVKAGKYAVAMKFSADPLQVHESSVNTDSGRDLGDRIVTISSGDFIVAVTEAIIEYPMDELHASLAQAAVEAGDYLSIDGTTSKFADIASGSITTPVIAAVYQVFGTKILVELLPVPVTP